MNPDLTPAPGPAARTQRTAGQVGAVLVVLELWLAFGWFNANDWTERQVLAVTAFATVAASAVQNLVGHLRRPTEVAPVQPAPPSPEAPSPPPAVDPKNPRIRR